MLAALPCAARQTSYERALEAYHGGDFVQAEELWLATLGQADVDRAAVLYDLGNVAYRRKRPLEAAVLADATLVAGQRERSGRFSGTGQIKYSRSSERPCPCSVV